MAIERQQISEEQVARAVEVLHKAIERRLEQKGRGAFLSRHEVLGVIEEEHHELVDAVRGEPMKAVVGELLDIAVGCVFGIACIEAGTLQW